MGLVRIQLHRFHSLHIHIHIQIHYFTYIFSMHVTWLHMMCAHVSHQRRTPINFTYTCTFMISYTHSSFMSHDVTWNVHFSHIKRHTPINWCVLNPNWYVLNPQMLVLPSNEKVEASLRALLLSCVIDMSLSLFDTYARCVVGGPVE